MSFNSDALFIAEKLRAAEEKVAEERGGFYLFGLFEHQEMPGRWNWGTDCFAAKEHGYR